MHEHLNAISAASNWSYSNMEKLKTTANAQRDIIKSLERLNRNQRRQNKILIDALDIGTRSILIAQEKEVERLNAEIKRLKEYIRDQKVRLITWKFDLMEHMAMAMEDIDDLHRALKEEDIDERDEDSDAAGESGQPAGYDPGTGSDNCKPEQSES